MKRNDWLARMGLQLPLQAQIRVVVCSDVSNEADDSFAVLHHLLTPSFDVRGIVAAHFESKAPGSRATMEQSYQGLLTLLAETGMEDVPALRGCTGSLTDENDAPDSEGVEFLIREALRDDPRPLYVTVLGALTDVAAALNRCPAIADRLTVVWIGGGPYPQGMREFNLMQDLAAARVVFASPAALWQIPPGCLRRHGGHAGRAGPAGAALRPGGSLPLPAAGGLQPGRFCAGQPAAPRRKLDAGRPARRGGAAAVSHAGQLAHPPRAPAAG